MQKVHGPAFETPVEARHGFLDHPGALVISLLLFFILYAIAYFGFFATS
jgi:hypothetical protein